MAKVRVTHPGTEATALVDELSLPHLLPNGWTLVDEPAKKPARKAAAKKAPAKKAPATAAAPNTDKE